MQIKLKSNKIDIPFVNDEGETLLTLYFDKTDENYKKIMDLRETIYDLQKETTDADKDIEDTKAYVKRIFDTILGDGSFDKVYEINPSVTTITSYTFNIVDGILEDMTRDMRSDVLNKYLK